MANVSGKKTLDQRRAEHAWRLVGEEVKSLPADKQKEFGTQTKKLPARILAAGLGQALAFLEAKKYAPDLLKALGSWIADRRPVDAGQAPGLLKRIIHGDADFLRFATAECLAYLQWVGRFADAEKLTD